MMITNAGAAGRGCLRVRLSGARQMLQIDARLPELQRFFAGHRMVAAVYLFGSYGTDRQTPLSDIDLAVLIRREDHPLGLQERLVLSDQISRILRVDDVDVVILNRMPATFRFKVLKHGRILYQDRESTELEDFIEETLQLYHDFIVDYEAFTREYDQARLEEAGCAS